MFSMEEAATRNERHVQFLSVKQQEFVRRNQEIYALDQQRVLAHEQGNLACIWDDFQPISPIENDNNNHQDWVMISPPIAVILRV